MNDIAGAGTPRVSVGLAVYNGENYLASTLDAILGQTFKDFEIVLSDNASTDGTAAICAEYASRDSRIRYVRNHSNIGSTRNFNRVFALARGEYFKWAAHDDLIAPDFLEKCVAALDQDPGAVLCHTKTAIIDAQGSIVNRIEGNRNASSARVQRRFHDILFDYWCYEIFGVIRSAALATTPLIGTYGHGEGVLLARLALIGRFHEIPEYLFCNRDHPAKSRYIYGTYREYTVWLDPSKAGKILLPRWRMGIEYFRAVGTSSLGRADRLQCYAGMLSWMRTFWMSLLANVAVAARDLARRGLRQTRLSHRHSGASEQWTS